MKRDGNGEVSVGSRLSLLNAAIKCKKKQGKRYSFLLSFSLSKM